MIPYLGLALKYSFWGEGSLQGKPYAIVRSKEWSTKMEEHSLFLDRKNQHHQNAHSTKSNAQFQCTTFQDWNAIFQRNPIYLLRLSSFQFIPLNWVKTDSLLEPTTSAWRKLARMKRNEELLQLPRHQPYHRTSLGRRKTVLNLDLNQPRLIF